MINPIWLSFQEGWSYCKGCFFFSSRSIVFFMTLIGYWTTTVLLTTFNVFCILYFHNSFFLHNNEFDRETDIFPFYANKEVIIDNQIEQGMCRCQNWVVDLTTENNFNDYPFEIQNDYSCIFFWYFSRHSVFRAIFWNFACNICTVNKRLLV